MKANNAAIAIATAIGLFTTGAWAQHEGHHNDQAAPPPASEANKTDTAKAHSMMSGGMMMSQNETTQLVGQLLKSFAAIEAEEDPAALRAKLAEHGYQLKALQTQVQAQSLRMDMMRQMMDGSMMNGKTMNGKMMGGTTAGDENKK